MPCEKRHKENFKVTKINAHLGSVPVMATFEDKFKTSVDQISFFYGSIVLECFNWFDEDKVKTFTLKIIKYTEKYQFLVLKYYLTCVRKQTTEDCFVKCTHQHICSFLLKGEI